MTRHLDDWIATLAAAPADRPLEALDAEIGRDIAARRREARAVKALAPLRMATVAGALAIGVTAGGAVAMAGIGAPHPAGPFAAATQLAPSALLEGVG
jgi:hypothetical protein